MRILNFILTSVFLFCFCNYSFSQENIEDTKQKSAIRILGAGINLHQFTSTDIFVGSDIPANKLMLTVSPTDFLRIEPEFGFRVNNGKGSRSSSKSFSYGTGIYGMWQKKSVNFYVGAKGGLLTVDYEDIEGWQGVIYENKSRVIFFGVAGGAEYLVGDHFSVGAQFALMVNKYQNFDDDDEDYNDSEDVIASETAINVRFYF